ncbi:hypothetical protein FHX08_004764 [Rhizobium sp. BK529]|uniref:hypothetical protein n=1 Tax=Rhizobium sp. BK529 TaxID=2586983 RepID=UPI001611662C|nr:hypothetical protein [Rhizobium sp. BK529]MBB3594360.1 hypothetical protein [Rhizobium sp. BK529]
MFRDMPEPVISRLRQMAKCYTSDEADAARFAERALRVLMENPSLLDGADIDDALFHVVHEIARPIH